jgi:hypothetical protein
LATVDIRKPLKKYVPVMLKAQADNLNEADTVQRIVKVFEDVLGYDGLEEITRETAVKDKYCDLAIKLEGTVRLLIEAKSAGTTLRERHIDQAQAYAAHANIPWVLLTNGLQWNLFHLTFEEGIEATAAFEADLCSDPDQACDHLALLHRQSLVKGHLDEYWLHRSALGPASLGNALFMEPVLLMLRREIRRREGLMVDVEDLGAAIHAMLSIEAREQIGPFKIRRKRAKRTAAAGEATMPRASEKPAAPTAAEPNVPPEPCPATGSDKESGR